MAQTSNVFRTCFMPPSTRSIVSSHCTSQAKQHAMFLLAYIQAAHTALEIVPLQNRGIMTASNHPSRSSTSGFQDFGTCPQPNKLSQLLPRSRQTVAMHSHVAEVGSVDCALENIDSPQPRVHTALTADHELPSHTHPAGRSAARLRSRGLKTLAEQTRLEGRCQIHMCNVCTPPSSSCSGVDEG
jgi:hypothetical protein